MKRAPLFSRIASAFASGLNRFRTDARAVAAVEFAMLLPIALSMYAMMVIIAEAMVVKRDVVFTARTITDLVSQGTPGSSATLSNATLQSEINAAAAVMTPWSSANLSIIVSEVQINADGTGTVIWSQAGYSGKARAIGSVVDNPGTKFAQGSFQILGEVSYVYTPLNIYFNNLTDYTLSEQVFIAPRSSNPQSVTLTNP